jgi:hypothetical protein
VIPERVWIFGCFSRDGHLLHDQDGSIVVHALPGLDDVAAHKLQRSLDSAPSDLHGSRNLKKREPEGYAYQHWTRDDWSYVTWWDRVGDDRGASHTGVLARGTWSDSDLVKAARQLAPWALRVPVETT